ncbi:MCR_0457 family protein [Acinetobacter rathckeae]|uniref:MCR_0457 family protein n=1 Tax=Acinetobacter rathckeae TaxID=2605272 RepID=UPI0018A28F89|nr:hypothetical protein [Acinetobacter rathckeae]MBF7687539.1 hypothetical protein [Acinetobacter rathckeae]MBF7694941.1 hypothetical protein [Acinetobacter rathckeae]
MSSFLLALPVSQLQAKSTNTDDKNIDVTPQQGGVTDEELAAIYVLSELCTDYGFKKDPAYRSGYAELVKENMPGIQNPVNALQMRAKQKDFKPFLEQARQDANKAGEADNKEICKEISSLAKSP